MLTSYRTEIMETSVKHIHLTSSGKTKSLVSYQFSVVFICIRRTELVMKPEHLSSSNCAIVAVPKQLSGCTL